MLFIDESAFTLVCQLYPDGSVHKSAAIELDSFLKMILIFTQSESYSF